jgi:hypothetical protein
VLRVADAGNENVAAMPRVDMKLDSPEALVHASLARRMDSNEIHLPVNGF